MENSVYILHSLLYMKQLNQSFQIITVFFRAFVPLVYIC